jgi:uncharacterized OsmC-like protein
MSDPNRSEYELTGTRTAPQRMDVDTGTETFVVGDGVNPVEYLLGSVLGCLNSTGTMVARDMGIHVEELEATVAGGVNYATYRGETSEDRPGLQGLEVTLSVTADADEAALEEWLAAVERRCPVTDNVENETGVEVTLDVR